MDNVEENCEMIWKIWMKSKLNSDKICTIWKKGKLNSQMIWKIWMKSSRIVIRYTQYGRKAS
jgi:hypothetical protein